VTHYNSKPIIKKNRIFDQNGNGIEISKNAKPIITHNQIFNNRFGGIEICSGSRDSVEIEKNKIFGNLNLINLALSNGKCLYQITKYKYYPFQNHYRCITCNSSEVTAICASCIKKCHLNHQIQFVRYDRFFCDCGAGSLKSPCLLVETRNDSSDQIEPEVINQTGNECSDKSDLPS
jgi:F-box protein 11